MSNLLLMLVMSKDKQDFSRGRAALFMLFTTPALLVIKVIVDRNYVLGQSLYIHTVAHVLPFSSSLLDTRDIAPKSAILQYDVDVYRQPSSKSANFSIFNETAQYLSVNSNRQTTTPR